MKWFKSKAEKEKEFNSKLQNLMDEAYKKYEDKIDRVTFDKILGEGTKLVLEFL